jgi:hypothetical protein
MDQERKRSGRVKSIAKLFNSYAVHQTVCKSNTLSHAQTQISEAEVILGTVAQPRKRKESMAKVRDGTELLVRRTREEWEDNDGISGEGLDGMGILSIARDLGLIFGAIKTNR